MAQFPGSPRVGRSQGVIIFWGLVSVFFAAAACFYFFQNRENQQLADRFRDQVMDLQEQRDTLSAEKDKIQSDQGETEKALKAREEFLQEKESKLAAEESRLEALGVTSQTQIQQAQAQAAVVRKFDDTVRKLAKDDTDVVLRGGRPVLRVPASVFFGYGDATLKPTGKALLTQLAQALDGDLDTFELRVECYTDTEGEVKPGLDAAAEPSKTGATTNAPAKTPPPDTSPHFASGWDLTAERAAVIGHFFHDTSLPFPNVIVVGRNDSQPIVTDAKDHARNRRVEITITPVPAPSHALDGVKEPEPQKTAPKDKPDDDPKPKPAKADDAAKPKAPKADEPAKPKASKSDIAKKASKSSTNAPSAKPPN